MAAAKRAAAKAPAASKEQAPPEVDEVHVRGGWDVGYRGERPDPNDDAVYTVAGVLAADVEE